MKNGAILGHPVWAFDWYKN